MRVGAAALVARAPAAATRVQPDQCAEQAGEAVVTCFAQSGLSELQICYADVAVPVCGRSEILAVEGIGWRVSESGRDAICTTLDAAFETHPDARRMQCKADCLQAARVRCPDAVAPVADR